MYIFFIISILAVFSPLIGLRCTEEFTYPLTFTFIFALHFLFTCITYAFYFSNYFVIHTYSKYYKYLPSEEDEEEFPIFEKQVKFFFFMNTFICLLQTSIAIFGATYMEKGKDLSCISDGRQWVFLTMWGNLFNTMHIIIIIFQAVMVEQVFYSIPNKHGHFNESGENSRLNIKTET
jgi:hypothetical protein